MTRWMQCAVIVSTLASVPAAAHAQQNGTNDKPDDNAQEPARPMGLPGPIKWTFNFDAGWGSFGFANSYYNNPKENVPENLGDRWFEGYVKPATSALYTTTSSGEIYGKLSAVGERTYGSIPGPLGQNISSFAPEDMYIGWRSGTSIDLGENVLDFSVGRQQYRLGHGFLLWDGSAEGGSRGGYWTNARKAFQMAAVGRFKPGPHTVETFYLDKDELAEANSGSRLWGTNYEFTIGKTTTLGATYMKWFAHKEIKPDRNHMDVYNVRAYSSPIPQVPDLSFEFEYAAERNASLLDSNAWTLQGAYEVKAVAWKPKVTYRYAFFQGDDPATPRHENFDPLFLGFSDWGTWWQGEIAGEYFLANSNLISHLIRAHVTPSDAIGAGVLLFKFRLDQPASFAPGVTDRNVAFETDGYVDWKVNHNFTLSFVAAFANPQLAVQQATGRTKNIVYGMAYIGYSF